MNVHQRACDLVALGGPRPVIFAVDQGDRRRHFRIAATRAVESLEVAVDSASVAL